MNETPAPEPGDASTLPVTVLPCAASSRMTSVLGIAVWQAVRLGQKLKGNSGHTPDGPVGLDTADDVGVNAQGVIDAAVLHDVNAATGNANFQRTASTVADALLEMQHEVTIPEDVRVRAKAAIDGRGGVVGRFGIFT